MVWAVGLTPGAAAAERATTANAQGLLHQADAAYNAGDREHARRLYRAVLAADPDNSRAVFRLAQLAPPGSAEAVALLRRYLALEPADPWGRMALGDALARSGAVDEGIEQYRRARRQAPAETDVYVGLGRILSGAGRTDELIETYEAWVSQQPRNASAWFELARARQRAQRHPEAADAYAQSLILKKDDRTFGLLEGALAESAFALRPYAGRSEDSDDNVVTRWGLDTDWQFTPRSRLGLHAERADVTDPFTSGTADEFALIARWQPLHVFRLEGLGGIARLAADQPDQDATNHPLWRLRFRWVSPADGPSLELRFAENPLTASPGLVAQPVELTETKAGIELPLAGPFRARARGQLGRLAADSDVNHRSGYQVGPLFRWRPAAEVGLFYGEQSYEHAAAVGYFAPQRVQIIELGTYFEYERLWPVTFALDAGWGQQSVTKFGEETGDWIRTIRLWALVSWELRPGTRLDLELEHSDSPVAGDAVTPTSDWKSNSAILALRFGVWPRSARTFLAERAGRGVAPGPAAARP
jgi:tetratricopeptide (TPR) repeat protein